MGDKIPEEIQKKIDTIVVKSFSKIIDKASKGDSFEQLVKTLIVDKINSKLKLIIKRPVIKQLAKIAVKKAVDKQWEKHKDELVEKLKKL